MDFIEPIRDRKNGMPMEPIMQKRNRISIAMTQRYWGLTDAELREAAEGLNL